MILAIDQGTTGSTALIVDRRGIVLGRGEQDFPQHYPHPGWVEHQPSEILASVRGAIRRALAQARLRPNALSAIGITNQRETTLLWHRATGRPIAPAIVWQCRRTAPACERLKRAGHASRIRERTGLVLDAYFSGTKIAWLLDHVPGARAQAQQGRLAFGTIDTWLMWQLTGGAVHATDPTNASRTLLYNIRTHRWDPRLCRLFRVPASVLPRVRPSSGLFGVTAHTALLPAGIPITGVAGDQQASMVGHGCVKPGTAKNTYGTGCFLLLNTGRRFVKSRHGLITTVAYGPSGPVYALEGSVFIAGAAIQWLRDELGLIRTAAETETVARRVRGTGGVYMVPAFVGLGAPYWDMGARGALLGLTRGTTRDVVVRATLESLAYQTRDVVDAMQQDSGLTLRTLRVDGGGAQNDWLMQFQADLLGIPVERSEMVEHTGKGAALLAGMGLGWWTPQALARLSTQRQRRFVPAMGKTERDALYAGWQRAVACVRSGHT